MVILGVVSGTPPPQVRSLTCTLRASVSDTTAYRTAAASNAVAVASRRSVPVSLPRHRESAAASLYVSGILFRADMYIVSVGLVGPRVMTVASPVSYQDARIGLGVLGAVKFRGVQKFAVCIRIDCPPHK